jgi:hypothetical protein
MEEEALAWVHGFADELDQGVSIATSLNQLRHQERLPNQ